MTRPTTRPISRPSRAGGPLLLLLLGLASLGCSRASAQSPDAGAPTTPTTPTSPAAPTAPAAPPAAAPDSGAGAAPEPPTAGKPAPDAEPTADADEPAPEAEPAPAGPPSVETPPDKTPPTETPEPAPTEATGASDADAPARGPTPGGAAHADAPPIPAPDAAAAGTPQDEPTATQPADQASTTDPWGADAGNAGAAPSTETDDGWGDDANTGTEDGWGDEADTGAEDGWGGGDDAGFDMSTPTVSEEEEDVPGELSVGGFIRQMVALWTERLETQPWSRARQSADASLRYKKRLPTLGPSSVMRIAADVHFEYDFAFQAKRELYDEATLDTYESQVVGGETFIALSWGHLDLTFGRQIVAWGHGEMLSPVDIVNPRDQRDPAISELDDIRMAVLASRAGLFFGSTRIELMVIHESYFGLRAAPMSDLSPLRGLILEDPQVGALLGQQSLRYRDVPGRFDSKASQVLARYAYTGEGIDLALYAASTLDKQGVALPPAAGTPPGPDGVALDLWHPRYVMLGHAGAMPQGDFVLRWEAGLDVERPLTATDAAVDGFNMELLRRNQLNWMAGASYGGFQDTTLSLEYQQSYVVDNPERSGGTLEFLVSPENPLMALRYSRNFLRETLQLSAVATVFGAAPFRGAMGRAELSYELRDALKIGCGYAIFVPSEEEFGPFYGMTTHDRLYFTTRWDFLLD